ncbi:MAG: hypothetical protein FWF10_08605 [Clostridiales bacterium]|nr:hypothetical protein [Clostridiales bacterium]
MKKAPSRKRIARKRTDREQKKRALYFLLGAGIIAVSFLCVLVSTLLFAAQEEALFDGDHYIATNIISAEDVGRPLSLPARLDLYLQAQRGTVGKPRMPGRDELSEVAAQAQAGSLWEAILRAHVPEDAKTFPSGDTPLDLSTRAQTKQVLRDFYAPNSGASLSLWVVQVYAENRAGEQVCLSVLLDSRTGDPYYVEFAGFAAVSPQTKQAGLAAICGSFGVTYPDLTAAALTYETDSYASITLRLTDEISIRKSCYYGVECVFELVFE